MKELILKMGRSRITQREYDEGTNRRGFGKHPKPMQIRSISQSGYYCPKKTIPLEEDRRRSTYLLRSQNA